jgi:hypothetical protein
MSKFELVTLLIAGICGGISVGAAVAATREYGRRRRERIAKQMAERRFSAIEQLGQWKDQRVLVIEDEALEAAINWDKADPEKLEKLVHMIRTLIEEEGIEPGDGDTLILGVKQEAHNREDLAQKPHTFLPGLQVTAGFG